MTSRILLPYVSQLLARFLVFFTSASVLVVEILALRILAPYLGVGLAVFTGVIGVILAGISVGAWVGGRVADRVEPHRLLGPMIVVGGLTAMISPLLIDLIGPALSNDPVSIVFASAIGFFVPAAVLSTIPPLVVKIRLSSLDETGTVVGSYSAVGTAGAIFGTFITGFVLIAAFPTRPIVTVVGALLVVIGLTLWSTRTRWQAAGTITGALLLGVVLLMSDGPCQVETAYSCAIVEVDENRDSGRILILDRWLNSYVDLDDPTHLEFRYIQLMADIIETTIPEGVLDVVSIGGGGMTLPGYFQATRPPGVNTVFEIDGAVVELARTDMGLSAQIDVVVDDARLALSEVPDDSADVVIGDAFSGASVPWHLTTVEYVTEIRRVLRPEGIYTMNVIDTEDLRFARATATTLSEVFENVSLFGPPSYLEGAAGGNFIFVASDSRIEAGAIIDTVRDRGGIENVISGAEVLSFANGAPLLRDDFAPVDQMLGRH